MNANRLMCLAGAAVLLAGTGCERPKDKLDPTTNIGATALAEPLAWVLASHQGDSRIDEDIRYWQAQVRAGKNPKIAIERLGWLFIAKAQARFDPGCYMLAEQCALCLDAREPGSFEAMLLRGHALQNQHRFREAEGLARELVARRGLPFDYGLLGDVLIDLGKVTEATEAYQTMIDLRPGPHSYARGAHVRWLKGDLEGATALMRLAAEASSPQDAESTAWIHSRLGSLCFQSGAMADAQRACDTALSVRPDYAPALLLHGRMLLAQGHTVGAIDALKRAVRAHPMPEYHWTLAEALRVAGRESEAKQTEAQLRDTGMAADPRTLSLYLATRGQEPDLAVRLARDELQQRQDVLSHDALAWALASAGRLDEAQTQMSRALAEGTQDARLFLHAGAIAAMTGTFEQASDWIAKASAMASLLLPTELQQLESAAALIERSAGKNLTAR